MSRLKPQTDNTTPADSTIQWPDMQLPDPHEHFGMTAEAQSALQQWYSSLQGSMNQRLAEMSREINQLKKQSKQSNT